MSYTRTLGLIFMMALLPTGVVLTFIGGQVGIRPFFDNLGLAIMVTAVIGIFRVTLQLRFESKEMGETIAELISERISEKSFDLKLVADERKEYPKYLQWVDERKEQELFFAGRSVLHRLDEVMKERSGDMYGAEDVIFRRLRQGANIRILFLDPRSDLVSRIAREENRKPESILSDLAKSVGICQRLKELIEEEPIRRSITLNINVYDEMPYFAYHKVDDQVITGFYFNAGVGWRSAAYEVHNPKIKDAFNKHFSVLNERSKNTYLLQIAGTSERIIFNDILFEEIRTTLVKALGHDQVDKLFKK